MKNFIQVKEVLFSQSCGKTTSYTDYIRPTAIVFIEPIIKQGMNVLKVHFNVGSTEHVVFLNETIESLEEKITKVYAKG